LSREKKKKISLRETVGKAENIPKGTVVSSKASALERRRFTVNERRVFLRADIAIFRTNRNGR
jgi:hypothetical protein